MTFLESHFQHKYDVLLYILDNFSKLIYQSFQPYNLPLSQQYVMSEILSPFYNRLFHVFVYFKFQQCILAVTCSFLYTIQFHILSSVAQYQMSCFLYWIFLLPVYGIENVIRLQPWFFLISSYIIHAIVLTTLDRLTMSHYLLFLVLTIIRHFLAQPQLGLIYSILT